MDISYILGIKVDDSSFEILQFCSNEYDLSVCKALSIREHEPALTLKRRHNFDDFGVLLQNC